MHAGGVHPHEEWLFGLVRAIDEIQTGVQKLLIRGFHAFASHRTGIFDFAVGGGFNDATWTIFFGELRILGVVIGLGLFFSVQVVEVTEKFIETVVGWQMIILITQMVLTELRSCVTMVLDQVGNGRCPVRRAMRGTRHADGQHTGTKWMLTKNERSAACGTGLLRIGIGEKCAFAGDTIDVGGLVTHDTVIVGTDIVHTHIITPDNQNIGFG